MFGRVKWGIHPKTHKTATANKPIENMKLPQAVIIPVRMHIGAPAEPIVKKGDKVKTGQVIATSSAPVSSNIHSSVSGTVVDILDKPHSIYGQCLSIIIASDGLDRWGEGTSVQRSWEMMGNDQISEIIKNAGIVGMGGAAFPSHIKLCPPKNKKIDALIINAAECEPFLTVDHRIMLEYTQRVATGIKIIKKLLSVENVFIGIEDNKMDAVKAMRDALDENTAKVVTVATRYPQGAEKIIIKRLLNREVASGKLPMDVGVVVQNVSTAVAICDAVINGTPLIERIITVSGGAIREPKNLKVRIGTTFADVIEFCGGFKRTPEKLIMGGAMMGIAQYTTEVSVIKGTSGILGLSKEDVNHVDQSACIRCGKCVNCCPMNLNPGMLGILSEKGLIDEAKNDYHLLDCMECGCCSFVCPAKRHIVQYIRYAKRLAADKVTADKGGK